MAKALSAAEAKVIKKGIQPALDYFYRLQGRMREAGFAESDPVYDMAKTIFSAISRMSIEMDLRSREKR